MSGVWPGQLQRAIYPTSASLQADVSPLKGPRATSRSWRSRSGVLTRAMWPWQDEKAWCRLVANLPSNLSGPAQGQASNVRCVRKLLNWDCRYMSECAPVGVATWPLLLSSSPSASPLASPLAAATAAWSHSRSHSCSHGPGRGRVAGVIPQEQGLWRWQICPQ